MKLSKGTFKVIVGDPELAAENDARSRANGKKFVPPWTVYEWDEDLQALDVHRAFAFSTKNLKPRYAFGRFPYKWAPSAVADVRLWLETTDELTLVTTHEEAITNG